MSTSKHVSDPIPFFNGHNYSVWADQMESYLRVEKLWKAIEEKDNPPQPASDATSATKEKYEDEMASRYKALYVLKRAVSETLYTHIQGLKSAYEAWIRLKEVYIGTSKTRHMKAQNLRMDFDSLVMLDNQPVGEYIEKVLKVANVVKSIGEAFPDAMIVEKILNSVPGKFESAVAALLQHKELPEITIPEVVTALQAAEHRISTRMKLRRDLASITRRVQRGKSSQSGFYKRQRVAKGKRELGVSQSSYKGNKYKGKAKFKVCSFCKKPNHAEESCWFRPNATCLICKNIGHVEKVCKFRNKPANTSSDTKISEKASVAGEMLLIH